MENKFFQNKKTEKINELATKCYQLNQSGSASYKKYTAQLINLLVEQLQNHYEQEYFYDAVMQVFNEMEKKWTPDDTSYYQRFKWLLDKRIINERNKSLDPVRKKYKKLYKKLRDEGREEEAERLSMKFTVRLDAFDKEDDDAPELMAESQKAEINMYEYVENNDKEILSGILKLINEAVREEQERKKGKKTFCYITRFYTETVTKLLGNENNVKEDEYYGTEIIPYLPENVLDRIDKIFAKHYLTGSVNTLEKIHNAKLKALSEFTGNSSDSQTKCGYKLRNIVYTSYIENVTGKKVSDAAISQQRDKYMTLISSAAHR